MSYLRVVANQVHARTSKTGVTGGIRVRDLTLELNRAQPRTATVARRLERLLHGDGQVPVEHAVRVNESPAGATVRHQRSAMLDIASCRPSLCSYNRQLQPARLPGCRAPFLPPSAQSAINRTSNEDAVVEQAVIKSRRILKSQSLASKLTEDLRKRIINGEFSVGTMLRQEQIAQEYGVSRMPVREALHQLDAEGLVVSQANRGALVTELSLSEINEILDLRLMLEPDLLARAIPNMTAETIAKSQAIQHQLDGAYETGDIGHWGKLNAEFHLSLYEPSGRSVTLAFIHRISVQVDRYMRLHMALTDSMLDGAADHHRLLALSIGGKVREAKALLVEHIRCTKAQLALILSARMPQE
ncbi:MAG: GntR family transcriptional regulator [Burkholderiales bacterium]|nr:GntR family transcriptional regulator [Burkholderiales bacterium]